ncbi:MAG: trypsin-like peptidase domain-containing protein [Acidobacteriota bacterium]
MVRAVRSRRLIGSLAAALLLGGVVQGRPARERVTAGGPGPAPPFVAATFPVATEVLFEARGESGRRAVTLEGIGTVLFGRYVLTVAHAATWKRFEGELRSKRSPGASSGRARKVKETTRLLLPEGPVPLRPLARDDRADVALFMLPRDTEAPPFPCAVGDSDAIRLGGPIVLVERDETAGPIVRPAAVAALRGTGRSATLSPPEQTFLVSLGLVSGESGSPLIRSSGGSCELVGLAQGTYVGARQLSWGIRIHEAMEALWRSGSPPPGAFFRRVCGIAARPESLSFCRE